MSKKDLYLAPETEVLEISLEQTVLIGSTIGENEGLGENTGEGW